MRLILGSRKYQCLHCTKRFLYSDSTIDVGFYFTMFGIILTLVTFAMDSFVFDHPVTHFIAFISYVFSLMIITLGLVFFHLSLSR
jgi:hypothetical protein